MCVPILEKYSGLKYIKGSEKKNGFYCGYSPERINPGDKNHRLINIKKVVSGSTPKVTKKINTLYKKIIDAGTHVVSSIKTAEASKIIENTQRDLNIAFVNELAIIFKKMQLDTEEVLKAAETKWNFLPFRPGLVGGHCIGVDPYYLTHKSQELNYDPKVILSGRKLNDNISKVVSNDIKNLLKIKKITKKKLNILFMGVTFKENCPDTRNSLAFKVVDEFKNKKHNCQIYDPWVNKNYIEKKYRNILLSNPKKNYFNAIVILTKHDVFKKIGIKKIRTYGINGSSIVYDLKYLFRSNLVDGRF